MAEYIAKGGKIERCPGFGQGPLPHFDAGKTTRERLERANATRKAKRRAWLASIKSGG